MYLNCLSAPQRPQNSTLPAAWCPGIPAEPSGRPLAVMDGEIGTPSDWYTVRWFLSGYATIAELEAHGMHTVRGLALPCAFLLALRG